MLGIHIKYKSYECVCVCIAVAHYLQSITYKNTNLDVYNSTYIGLSTCSFISTIYSM